MWLRFGTGNSGYLSFPFLSQDNRCNMDVFLRAWHLQAYPSAHQYWDWAGAPAVFGITSFSKLWLCLIEGWFLLLLGALCHKRSAPMTVAGLRRHCTVPCAKRTVRNSRMLAKILKYFADIGKVWTSYEKWILYSVPGLRIIGGPSSTFQPRTGWHAGTSTVPNHESTTLGRQSQTVPNHGPGGAICRFRQHILPFSVAPFSRYGPSS